MPNDPRPDNFSRLLTSRLILTDGPGVTAALACARCGQPVDSGTSHTCPLDKEKTDGPTEQ